MEFTAGLVVLLDVLGWWCLLMILSVLGVWCLFNSFYLLCCVVLLVCCAFDCLGVVLVYLFSGCFDCVVCGLLF